MVKFPKGCGGISSYAPQFLGLASMLLWAENVVAWIVRFTDGQCKLPISKDKYSVLEAI